MPGTSVASDGRWCRRTPAFPRSNVSAVIKDIARYLLRPTLDRRERSAGQQGRDLADRALGKSRDFSRQWQLGKTRRALEGERDLKAREQPQILVRQRPTPQQRRLESIRKLGVGLNRVERIVRASGHDRICNCIAQILDDVQKVPLPESARIPSPQAASASRTYWFSSSFSASETDGE